MKNKKISNAIQKLIAITVPNMKSCFALLFVTGMINGLARFTDIYILGGMDCYGGAGGTLQTILMYVFQFSFVGKKFWFIFMLAVMMVPFESRLVPLFLQYRDWGLLNTWWPLILGQFAYVYGTFFARSYISSIPDSLAESVYIDGGSEWRVFFSVIIPLSKPIMSTLAILQVISNWNAYLWPMVVIRDYKKQMISVGVALFNANQNAMYYGPRMAVAVLSAIPLVILYLILQKHIVASIAVTGIKQ